MKQKKEPTLREILREIFCALVKFTKETATSEDIKPAYRALFSGSKRGDSPIRKGPLHRAGGYAFSKGMVQATAILLSISLILGIIVPIIFPFYITLIIVLLLLAAIPIWDYQNKNYDLGYFGERIVADELDKLGRSEWRIFHGVELKHGGGDIDHIIVCRKGVFCVETKALRRNPTETNEKLVYERTDDEAGKILRNGKPLNNPDPIKQSRGNAARLYEYLKEECNLREEDKIPFIVSIITFPGWTIEIPHGNYNDDVIPCKPESIKTIFGNRENKLDHKMFEKICAAIEKINRVDLTYDL